MARVLVTGASGFIGKRLVYHLLQKSHTVYALVRLQGFTLDPHPNLHYIYGDLEDLQSLPLNLELNLDAAYYLVHSMASVTKNLAQKEVQTAKNFTSWIEKLGIKQIIYLSGIIEDPSHLSEHLGSRLQVENVLKQSAASTTVLRSSIILGAGSASFEIIRDLVEKLPIMVAPKWVRNISQPIAVIDVLYYLEGVLLCERAFGKSFDIGGPQPISFKDVLLRYAKFRGLRRVIIDIPVLTPKLSSYWLFLITNVNFSICRYLVESMRYNTRKINCEIDVILPHKCLSFEDALQLIFQKIAHNEVVSTWMDAWNFDRPNLDLAKFIQVPKEGCFMDQRKRKMQSSLSTVQDRIWSLGGDKGWLTLDWAWKLRGFIDRLLGGSGMNRGRRDPHELRSGDSLDFWKVILADKTSHRLILYAQMKLPGEAWLEFQIDEKLGVLIQTATFRPRGFWGRAYWYFCAPFHFWIFPKMIKLLAK